MLMAFSFLGLAISGVVMYIAPPCSVADRIGWTVFALSKDQWASMHHVSALFILVLAILHLFVYNWKTFMCYLRDRRSKRQAERELEQEGSRTGAARFRMPKELIAALVAATIMYAGALTLIAPFGWLHEGSDAIKEHYRQEAPSGTGRGYGTGERDGYGSGFQSVDENDALKTEAETEIRRDGRGLGAGRREGSGQGRGRTLHEAEAIRDTTG